MIAIILALAVLIGVPIGTIFLVRHAERLEQQRINDHNYVRKFYYTEGFYDHDSQLN